MGPRRKATRMFIVEFINLYKRFPCLWQTNSTDYRNRAQKDRAYTALVEKCREIDEAANLEMVKKKINNLRTTHRKEVYKVKKAESAGCRKVYRPSIWYFDLFSFLSDNDITPKRRTQPRDYYGEILRGWNSAEAREEDAEDEISDRDSSDTEQHVCDENDPFLIFGRYVVAKLRIVDGEQQLLAKQLIEEVLREARAFKLTMDSQVLNTQVEDLPSIYPPNTMDAQSIVEEADLAHGVC